MYQNQENNKPKINQFSYKKLITILSIFLLLGSVLFLYFSSTAKDDTFSIFLQSGDVSFKVKDSKEYSKIVDEKVDVQSHSFVKTGENSKAVVITPNNSVMSLDENTELQLKSNNNITNIEQFAGNVWYRINKLKDKEVFNTNTNQSTAAVRGTKYLVNVEDDQKTRIVLTEGKVIASEEESDNKKEKIEILPNEQVLFGKDQVKKDIMDFNILDSNWMQQNKTMDTVFDKKKIDNDIVTNWINTEETKKNNLNESTELKIKYNKLINNNPCAENIETDIYNMNKQIPTYNRNHVMDTIKNINSICNSKEKSPVEQKNLIIEEIKNNLQLNEEENKLQKITPVEVSKSGNSEEKIKESSTNLTNESVISEEQNEGKITQEIVTPSKLQEPPVVTPPLPPIVQEKQNDKFFKPLSMIVEKKPEDIQPKIPQDAIKLKPNKSQIKENNKEKNDDDKNKKQMQKQKQL